MIGPARIRMLNGFGHPDYTQGLCSELARDPSLEVQEVDFRVPVKPCSSPRSVRFATSVGNAFGNAVGLARYLAVEPRAIMHFQWLGAPEVAHRLLTPALVHRHQHRLVFTVHNVDMQQRNEGRSSLLNRATLRHFYRQVDGLIVHSCRGRDELSESFGVVGEHVAVAPMGLFSLPDSGLTRSQARTKVGLASEDRVLLCFGHIERYKGVDVALEAAQQLHSSDTRYILLIVGSGASDPKFLQELVTRVDGGLGRVVLRIGFLANHELEPYFKAADCALLPYRRISQSGIPSTALHFGLPLIANDVGGLSEMVDVGTTGVLYGPSDEPNALADAVTRYFAAPLSDGTSESRRRIRMAALDTLSWPRAAESTARLYRMLW